ncbi:hypothetical protein GCM10027402_30700 [Arthrobacter monumenti]
MAQDGIVAQDGMLGLDDIPDPEHHQGYYDGGQHVPAGGTESGGHNRGKSKDPKDNKNEEARHTATIVPWPDLGTWGNRENTLVTYVTRRGLVA